jgi:heterodisulfide reductase subunit A
VKTAIEVRRRSPGTNVFVVHKDMRAYGFHEARYREARERGVRFIRMAEGTAPEVAAQNGRLEIKVLDDTLRAKLNIPADLLVLSTGVVPGEHNKELAQKLKVPLNQDGFFLEAHMKLRPVDFATEGIFLCGLAHGPKTAEESIVQARAAAARAATILSKQSLQLEAAISDVVDQNCDGCAYCVEPCPYQAITLIEYVVDGSARRRAPRREFSSGISVLISCRQWWRQPSRVRRARWKTERNSSPRSSASAATGALMPERIWPVCPDSSIRPTFALSG